MVTTLIECLGGYLVAYHEIDEWVSASTAPRSCTGSVWMVPGWL